MRKHYQPSVGEEFELENVTKWDRCRSVARVILIVLSPIGLGIVSNAVYQQLTIYVEPNSAHHLAVTDEAHASTPAHK
jgi:hypothetical protein